MANVKNITKIIVGEDLYYLKDKQVRDSIGATSGIATLDASGKVPSSQLPSYVDDVIDAYYYNSTMYEDSEHTTAITPETGKIYVDLHTNESYRWSGTTYVVLSSPYVLPTASANVLGGIKVGTNLSIDNNGVLSAAGAAYTEGDGIDITNNAISVDTTVCRIGGSDSQQALNAPDIVNNVAYNSSTGKLTMVKNSVSSDIVSIVTNGFALTTNESTGIDTFTAIGSATITVNDTTGVDTFTF